MSARADREEALADALGESVPADEAWMQDAAEEVADRYLGFAKLGALILQAHKASAVIRGVAGGQLAPPVWPHSCRKASAAESEAFAALCRGLLPLVQSLDQAVEKEINRRFRELA